MNAEHETRLRAWLEARDPGDAPAGLRTAAARIPFETRQPMFPALDAGITRVFGPAPWVRAALALLVILALVAAAAGAARFQPWRPFPPRGLIAYTAPLSEVGSTGIFLVAADGGSPRRVSPPQANMNDRSPKWSRDGRTLLIARTTQLSAFASCEGVGSVVLYDVASGTERVVATGLRPMNVIDWSPSGDRAAYVYPPPGCGAEVELGVVDLATGHVTTTVVLPQESEADPSQGMKWHVAWSGDTASAVPDALVATANGRDFTTTTEVLSHDRRFTARSAWTTPSLEPTIKVSDGTTGASVDLGPGAVPVWSPDDKEMAFLQPGGPAGPNFIDYLRYRLAIVTVATWQTRLVADVLVGDGLPPDALPTLAWTGDGDAVFWFDGDATHVVDVVTGRSAELSAIPKGCTSLAWQPVR